MIIKSLAVTGKDKVPATLYFSHGANIIAGASDTGKSYVLQCLKFILGSGTPPKSIDESEGYTTLIVDFEEAGSRFSLSRGLYSKAPIMLTEEGAKARRLSTTHKAGNDRNLSNYLMRKLSLEDKMILDGKESLKTSALSIRVLEKLFVVDETRIVAEQSPLGTGQNNGSTPETSLLRAVLTGRGDSEAKVLKQEIASTSSIQQKISTIHYLLSRLYPDGKEALQNNADSLEAELEGEEAILQSREDELNTAISGNNELLDEKKGIVANISALDSKISESTSLHDRFCSLTAKYQSDRERLVGIREATGLLDMCEDVACPICGGEVHQESQCADAADLIPAIQAEIEKIDFHIGELSFAITDLLVIIESDQSNLDSARGELEFIESKLDSSLSDLLEQVNDSKSKCASLNSKVLSLRYAIKSIDNLNSEIDELSKGLSAQQPIYHLADFTTELKGLAKSIELVLERWGFPGYKPTDFDLKARDLVIGGKPRQSFGKGYRAIGFSAFAIGLMQYLSPLGRHPGFVVLDSPLTTYKQADQDRGEEQSEEDMIAGDMVYSFYSDIAQNYKDKQVIIFDNQEPDLSIISQVNYVHFSRNKESGRFGFFLPVEGKDYTRKRRSDAASH